MTAQGSTKTAVWGAAVLVIGTSVGLAALDWAVLVLHGLTYGMARVLGASEPSPPDSNRYGWALAVGLVVDVGGTAATLWLFGLATARQWRAGVALAPHRRRGWRGRRERPAARARRQPPRGLLPFR